MQPTNHKMSFGYGIKQGLPITIGYVPVAFAFGLMAVNGGIHPLLAILISLSNLTSAGQFAGTNLIIAGVTYAEITLTTFVINIRYMLMSLSLSQKLAPKVSLMERLLLSFGITDETFAVASSEKNSLTFTYMIGLIIGPIAGWTGGTALGALVSEALPATLTGALGIALYGMFLAILVPPCKHNLSILLVVVLSCILSCLIKYVKVFHLISSGFRVILVTILVCTAAAILFPIKEDELL